METKFKKINRLYEVNVGDTLVCFNMANDISTQIKEKKHFMGIPCTVVDKTYNSIELFQTKLHDSTPSRMIVYAQQLEGLQFYKVDFSDTTFNKEIELNNKTLKRAIKKANKENRKLKGILKKNNIVTNKQKQITTMEKKVKLYKLYRTMIAGEKCTISIITDNETIVKVIIVKEVKNELKPIKVCKVAKCHYSDTFNLDKGVALALSRAETAMLEKLL